MSSKIPNRKISLENALSEFGVSYSLEPVLNAALAEGGALSELFFERSDQTAVFMEGGKIDKIRDGVDGGVGMRVIFANRSVYGYTTELSEDSLMNLAHTLSAAVKAGTQSGSLDESEKDRKASSDWQQVAQSNTEINEYAIQKDPKGQSLQDRIKTVERADRKVREVLPTVKQITAGVLDTYRKILIVNSDGAYSPESKTYNTFLVQLVGEVEGRVESCYEVESGYMGLEMFEQESPEQVAERAAKKLKILLTASPAPSGAMPVVMAADAGGTMIHEAVGHGLEADLACNGLSVYGGKVGEQVASPKITVIDDGTMPTKRGSFAFDDEGTPSKKNVLIENGVLKGYMVDRLSAMKFDLMATGNGRRETFRHQPIVRMTNTYIAPGKDSPEEILKDTKWGVYVKSMGGGQVNTVTGDFVFAVTEGYLIRDGKAEEPIRGATLVGNGPNVLKIIDKVGTDLGYAQGTCGKDGQGAPVTDAQPTIRIPELTVGGEVPISQYWDGK